MLLEERINIIEVVENINDEIVLIEYVYLVALDCEVNFLDVYKRIE